MNYKSYLRVMEAMLLLVALFLFGTLKQASQVDAATDLVADVSSYQPDTLAFFQSLKNKGVKGVVVKVTEGSADGAKYVNPKAKAQIANAKAAGLAVNAYHYAKFNSTKYGTQDPINEAKFLVENLNKLGISASAGVALDIEDMDCYSSSNQLTADINTFLSYVKTHGYPNIITYSMQWWFVHNDYIQTKNLIDQSFWVANYGDLGISCDVWQFTSTFDSGYKLNAGDANNVLLDMSQDFTQFFLKPHGYEITAKNYQQLALNYTGHNYSFFNTPSPLADSKLLLAGTAVKNTAVRVIAAYKVSNGETYYNFQYGNRYYWCNSRAFTASFKVLSQQSLNQNMDYTNHNYGFFNTPSPLPAAKLLLAGTSIKDTEVHVIASNKVSNGETYYNFKYGNRYYWCNSRAFVKSPFKIISRESVNRDIKYTNHDYSFFNTPSPLPNAKLLLQGAGITNGTVRAIATYKISNGETYYNFKYGDRYYWCNTRAFS